ncbi:conserved hypothetical protein [Burkholderiales bacterium 8X]|nr:conserved hypothetical protein [Burkholderiales bacterium 8X]
MRDDRPRAKVFELVPRHVLRLPDADGLVVSCRSGTIWITIDHDPCDVVLDAGQRYVGRVHRPMIVSAFERSCVELSTEDGGSRFEHGRQGAPRRPASSPRLQPA